MKGPRLLITGTVAVIAIAFFVWLTNAYVLRSEADQKKASVTVALPTAPAGTAVPVSFFFAPKDAQDVISGTDVYVEVENGQISGWTGCSNVDDTATTFTEMISKTGKDARYSCVVLKEAKALPKTVFVKGQATCAGTSPMKVRVLKDKTDVVGPVEGAEYALEVVNEATYACDGTGGGPKPSPAPTEDMLTHFRPDSCTGNVGDTCNYELKISARNSKDRISGIYMRLTYDKGVLDFSRMGQTSLDDSDVQGIMAQALTPTPAPATNVTPAPVVSTAAAPTAAPVTDLTPTATPTLAPVATGVPATVTPTAGQTLPPISPIPSGCQVVITDNKPGELSFMYLCNKAASQLGSTATFPLSFKALGNGSGDISIDAVQISGPDITGPYSVNRTKATYSIGGGGTVGNLKLNMKLRMQCVVNKPRGADTMKVKIGLADGGLKSPMYETATFKADEKGFWNGTVSFKAPAGNRYKLLPKGEKHMQKKICVNNATEDYPGAYRCDKGAITLKDGENAIDLSKVILLSGDLPPGEQDGISNAKDQSLVRNLIGKRDAESVQLADINYDGVVNAVDHSCLIAALSVRWDEE